MELELKENMYIRTKDGIIDKIIFDYNGHCADPHCKCKHLSCAKNYYDEDEVIKASYNIIDLIEVGDYVNGKKIVDIGCLTNGPREGTKVIDYYITPSAVSYLENEDIKSVVAKELFEYMEYRIGE